MTGMYLGGSRVGDPLDVNPVDRLLVFWVVDLLGWVDRWVEVGEQAAGMGLVVINADGIGVVGARHRRQYAC